MGLGKTLPEKAHGTYKALRYKHAWCTGGAAGVCGMGRARRKVAGEMLRCAGSGGQITRASQVREGLGSSSEVGAISR